MPTASPPGAGPADRHLGDVHAVLAEDRADAADDAGHVVVAEDQQAAVEIGFQPVVVERHQPRHVLAEERAGGAMLCRRRSSLRPSSTSGTRPCRSAILRSSLMPRCCSSSSALTMFTSSSSAFCNRPAANAAVSTLVSLSAISPRYVQAARLAGRPAASRPAAGPGGRRRRDSRGATRASWGRATPCSPRGGSAPVVR